MSDKSLEAAFEMYQRVLQYRPTLTPEQAEEALSDAMLVSAVSLLLALGAAPGETSAYSEDGRIGISWSDDADFSTGIGTYTITMVEYAVPAEDLVSTWTPTLADGSTTWSSQSGLEVPMPTRPLLRTVNEPPPTWNRPVGSVVPMPTFCAEKSP